MCKNKINNIINERLRLRRKKYESARQNQNDSQTKFYQTADNCIKLALPDVGCGLH